LRRNERNGGSSPDNVRDESASSDGSGSASSEEKVYARNHCPKPCNCRTRLKPDGYGSRCSAWPSRDAGSVNSEAGSRVRWGGHVESLRRRHGEAAGVEAGASLLDRFRGERGNHLRSPFPPGSRSGGGQARCRLMAVRWGGGLVVVRARERRVHGEGDQQVGSGRTGRSGGCRR